MIDRLASVGEVAKKAPAPVKTGARAVVYPLEKGGKWWKRNVHFRNQEGVEVTKVKSTPTEHLLLPREEVSKIETPLQRPFIETQLLGVNILRTTTRRYDAWDETRDGTNPNNVVGKQVLSLFKAETTRTNIEGKFVNETGKKPQPVDLGASHVTMPDGTSVSGIKIKQPDGSEIVAQQIIGRKDGKFLCRVAGQKEIVQVSMGDVLRAQVLQESTALSSLMVGNEKTFFDHYTGSLRDVTTDPGSIKTSTTLSSAIGATDASRDTYNQALIYMARNRGMITRNDYMIAMNKITGYSSDTPPSETDKPEAFAKFQHREQLKKALPEDVNIVDGESARVLIDQHFDRVRTHAQHERNNATEGTISIRKKELEQLDHIAADKESLVANFDAVQAGALKSGDAIKVRDLLINADVREGPARLMELAKDNIALSNQVDEENAFRGSRKRKTYKTIATILLLLAGASYMIVNKGMGAGEERGGY